MILLLLLFLLLLLLLLLLLSCYNYLQAIASATAPTACSSLHRKVVSKTLLSLHCLKCFVKLDPCGRGQGIGTNTTRNRLTGAAQSQIPSDLCTRQPCKRSARICRICRPDHRPQLPLISCKNSEWKSKNLQVIVTEWTRKHSALLVDDFSLRVAWREIFFGLLVPEPRFGVRRLSVVLQFLRCQHPVS